MVTSTGKKRIQPHDILFVRSLTDLFVLEMNMHLPTEKLPSAPVLEWSSDW